MLFVIALGGTLGGLTYIFRHTLIGIYNSDPGVLEMGNARSWIVPLYFLCGMMEVASGQMRGMGYSITPMIISLTGACVFRIIWIYTIFAQYHTIEVLMLSYPISWILTTIAHYISYVIVRRKYPKEDMPLDPA